MRNGKQLLILGLIVLSIIGIILVIYYMFFYNFGGQPVTPVETPTTTTASLQPAKLNTVVVSDTASTTTAIVKPSPEVTVDYNVGVTAAATNFIERFGTYSSQSGKIYLEDLQLLVTPSMYKWLKSDYDNRSAEAKNYQTYYAVKTLAVSKTVTSIDETLGKAVVTIGTQRTEDKNGDSRVFTQTAKLELVRSGKQWKIDAIYWQ